MTDPRIEQFARHCVATLWSVHGDDMVTEPDEDQLASLGAFLGRPLTGEDESAFTQAWEREFDKKVKPSGT